MQNKALYILAWMHTIMAPQFSLTATTRKGKWNIGDSRAYLHAMQMLLSKPTATSQQMADGTAACPTSILGLYYFGVWAKKSDNFRNQD
jgi:hypothetical protein